MAREGKKEEKQITRGREERYSRRDRAIAGSGGGGERGQSFGGWSWIEPCAAWAAVVWAALVRVGHSKSPADTSLARFIRHKTQVYI